MVLKRMHCYPDQLSRRCKFEMPDYVFGVSLMPSQYSVNMLRQNRQCEEEIAFFICEAFKGFCDEQRLTSTELNGWEF